MSSSNLLLQAFIYLAAAVLSVPIFKRLGLGSVLGYLIAGILIGPHTLQLIGDPKQVLHFAEFGVVLLLFLIGLELEPERVWALRRSLVGLGGGQVLGTIAVMAGAAYALGVTWQVAVIAAAGIAMSSTAIGLASIEERRLLGTSGGRASFAVLLFQDLSVIPLFILLALMAPDTEGGATDVWAIPKALAMIAAIIIASRTILRPAMRMVAKTGMREIFFGFSLLLVIGVSLAVQVVGLSMELGAFLAGVLLANSEYRYELRLDLEPIKGLLLGLFFIAVGMLVDVSLVLGQPQKVFGLALLIMAVKMGILFGLGRLFKLTWQDSLLMGVALSQIGEFAFVIFSAAPAQRFLSRDTYNLLNAVVAVSMLLTPFLFVVYGRLMRAGRYRRPRESIKESNPVIVAGFGRFGQIVGRVLMANGISATLIDNDPDQVEVSRQFGWRCYYGDASRLDVLKEAGIAKAKLLVIAINDSEAAEKMAKLVQQRWPRVPIIIRARSRTDAFNLRDLGLHPIREVLHSSLEASRQALVALGESAGAAARIVRQFEHHDQRLFEAMRNVRDDRQAVLDLMAQGRRDLNSILATERQDMQSEKDASASPSGPDEGK